jgi:hypothetical protein
MGLLTYFHDGGGVLIESRERVAKSLGFARDRIDYCIKQLDEGGWLEVSESGMIFEPVVYKYITGNEHPDGSESSRISQDLAKSGRILHFSPGETSPVEESREFSGDPNPTKRTVTITEQNKNQEKDREFATLSLSFPGLTDQNFGVIKNEFPNLDFATVYEKFVDHHTSKGTNAATLAMLRGWFKREKPASPGQAVEHELENPKANKPDASKSKKSSDLERLRYVDCPADLRCEVVAEVTKPYGWFIGKKKMGSWCDSDFKAYCRNMPKGDYDECRDYLLAFTGGAINEWDIKDALQSFSGETDGSKSKFKFLDVLFTETNWDENGFEPIEWSGTETAEKEAENEKAA